MAKTSDRQLLEKLFKFMQGRNFITMDSKSLTDMVKRYQNPPLTALNRVAMQMTAREYEDLSKLLTKIREHLKDEEQHEVSA